MEKKNAVNPGLASRLGLSMGWRGLRRASL